jgi:hypothetical protein
MPRVCHTVATVCRAPLVVCDVASCTPRRVARLATTPRGLDVRRVARHATGRRARGRLRGVLSMPSLRTPAEARRGTAGDMASATLRRILALRTPSRARHETLACARASSRTDRSTHARARTSGGTGYATCHAWFMFKARRVHARRQPEHARTDGRDGDGTAWLPTGEVRRQRRK